MRIAIPVEQGHLAQHFGHTRFFALVDADPVSKRISAMSEIAAPEHQPGLLPPWLKERGVTHVISGGMGSRARALFAEASIEVVTGAPAESASTLAERYLDGTLVTSPNACDH
jgi:predicted Fe-Mo cluster-binding NifX family protein